MKRIINYLINLKDILDRNISPNKQKIIVAATTVPMVAVSSMTGVAAASCPYGLTYCPFPGQCGRYTDLNGNGVCDLALSQVNAQTSTASTGSSSQTSTQGTSHSSSSSSSSSSGDSSGGVADTQNADHSNASATTVHDPSSGVGGNSGNDFHMIPVSILIVGAYFFTHYLFSKGILKPQIHKRLWNLLMLGSYLGTGVTGLLLIYMINWGVLLAYRYGLAYWHAELALLMTVVTIIHFHIYRKAFKKMFSVLFNFRSPVNKNRPNKTVGTSK